MTAQKKKSQQQNLSSDLAEGYIPPHSDDIEEAVLGAIMISTDKNTRYAITFLKPDDFYYPRNQLIFTAITGLYFRGDDIDLLTVSEELRSKNVLDEIGGPYTLAVMLQKVSSTQTTPTHVKILKQKSLQRQIMLLCQEKTKEVFYEDVFNVIDDMILQLNKLNDSVNRSDATTSANKVISSFMADMTSTEEIHRYLWKTGDPKFDDIVGFTKDKMILISGGAKHGKTKYTMAKMFYLFDHYDDVACYWVTLEDSAKSIAANYLAQKLFIKPKDIMRRKFSKDNYDKIKHYLDKFNSFDIEFQEQSAKSYKIKNDFKNFCKIRENKLCILIVDNILSLQDREDFKGAENSMYDYIMNQMLAIRQETKGLIIPIHHYKDSQQEETRIKSGFRPRLTDLKGTEAFRRVPNAVLMINNPGKYDDLMNEYGEQREELRYLYIVDTGANREDESRDDVALIRYLHTLDFNIFLPI